MQVQRLYAEMTIWRFNGLFISQEVISGDNALEMIQRYDIRGVSDFPEHGFSVMTFSQGVK